MSETNLARGDSWYSPALDRCEGCSDSIAVLFAMAMRLPELGTDRLRCIQLDCGVAYTSWQRIQFQAFLCGTRPVTHHCEHTRLAGC
jgi:hypothetical protein